MNFIFSLKKATVIPMTCMDTRVIGLEKNILDGIWCCAVLLHLPKEDANLALSEFRRILKPGGVLYVSVKEGEGEEWLEEGHIPTPRFFKYYFLEEISTIVKNHGFEILYSQIKPHKSGRHGWVSIYAAKK